MSDEFLYIWKGIISDVKTQEKTPKLFYCQHLISTPALFLNMHTEHTFFVRGVCLKSVKKTKSLSCFFFFK